MILFFHPSLLMVSQKVRTLRCAGSFVIPAEAGIRKFESVINYLDPGFRRGDDLLQNRRDFKGFYFFPLLPN
jgi:hypothetical protein